MGKDASSTPAERDHGGAGGVLNQAHGKGLGRGTSSSGKSEQGENWDKPRSEKTQDVHSCGSCWDPGKLPHPGGAGTLRRLKHLACRGRWNDVINSVRTL